MGKERLVLDGLCVALPNGAGFDLRSSSSRIRVVKTDDIHFRVGCQARGAAPGPPRSQVQEPQRGGLGIAADCSRNSSIASGTEDSEGESALELAPDAALEALQAKVEEVCGWFYTDVLLILDAKQTSHQACVTSSCSLPPCTVQAKDTAPALPNCFLAAVSSLMRWLPHMHDVCMGLDSLGVDPLFENRLQSCR